MLLRITLVVLCLLLGLAACGGDAETTATSAAPETSADATAAEGTTQDAGEPGMEGVFEGTTRITESTIPRDRADIGKDIQRTFIFTCMDESCEQVYQRSDAPAGTRAGGTWLFERAGDELTARDVRTGPCDEGGGEYRQEMAWTWTAQDDGSMEGELVQEFTGCGADATSTTETTRPETPTDTPPPYASSEDARGIGEALTRYDAAFTKVNAGYQTCDRQLGGAARIEGARCFARLLAVWAPALHELHAYLQDGPPADAPARGCASAWKDVDGAGAVAEGVEKAAARFAAGGDGASELQGALKANESFQTNLTQLAYYCVPPEDAESLGNAGRLTFDTNSTLTPNDDGR